MSKESITLETVEDLAKFATSHIQPWMQSKKYDIHSNSSWEWDDPAAGKTWSDNRPSYRSNDPTWAVEDNAYSETRPDSHTVKSYYLESRTSGRHFDTIWISETLYNLLDSVWTKREAYHGSTYTKNVGGLTLVGMLKRLGKTEIKGQVDAALKAAQDQEAANLKASRQDTARRLAKELAEFMARFPGDTNMMFTISSNGVIEK
jgi:hypothetical protein